MVKTSCHGPRFLLTTARPGAIALMLAGMIVQQQGHAACVPTQQQKVVRLSVSRPYRLAAAEVPDRNKLKAGTFSPPYAVTSVVGAADVQAGEVGLGKTHLHMHWCS